MVLNYIVPVWIGGKGHPHLILITDGRPTETTLYAGEDQHIRNTEEEVNHLFTWRWQKLCSKFHYINIKTTAVDKWYTCDTIVRK